jgi:hypothetical protein
MSQTTEALRELRFAVEDAVDGAHLSVNYPRLRSEILSLLDQVPVAKHPLGFYHCELTTAFGASEPRIRLHIWTSASMQARDDTTLTPGLLPASFSLVNSRIPRMTCSSARLVSSPQPNSTTPREWYDRAVAALS